MHCSLCKASGHNKRTCPTAPPASEVRAANKLAALLPSPRAPKAVSKSLEGLQDCAKSFKEPKEFFAAAKTTSKPVRVCSKCGGSGHNSRTCAALSLMETTKALVGQRRCGLCGDNGHNRRSCVLAQPLPLKPTSSHTVNAKTCSICGEKGHNSRTCPMKCKPCSDQVARSYCFAGMSAKQAVEMTKILECGSIYGETEEYPHLLENASP